MADDSAATEGTGAPPPGGVTEPSGQQQTPPAGGANQPEPNADLTAAQAEAATWRGRYRDLQGKFDTAVADARKSGDEAISTMRDRLVGAEVRAIAANRLADPADATRFLDDSKFVNAKGEIDGDGIGKAIDDLLSAKPYLAIGYVPSNGNGNGHGSADQGARGGSKPPPTTADAFNAIIRGPAKQH